MTELIVNLKDVITPEKHKTHHQVVRICPNSNAIEIKAPGYGDYCSVTGEGSPVLIELHEGILRVIVWADINSEEPTHIIPLAQAKEIVRKD